jgi:hypothetical protein
LGDEFPALSSSPLPGLNCCLDNNGRKAGMSFIQENSQEDDKNI